MPLLVGLQDIATARRSLDGTLQLERRGGDGEVYEEEVDLEDLAAKKAAGGGLIDSVANMANSILGAGMLSILVLALRKFTSHDPRYYWQVTAYFVGVIIETYTQP